MEIEVEGIYAFERAYPKTLQEASARLRLYRESHGYYDHTKPLSGRNGFFVDCGGLSFPEPEPGTKYRKEDKTWSLVPANE
jgi:hypothetical protein